MVEDSLLKITNMEWISLCYAQNIYFSKKEKEDELQLYDF